MEQIALFKIICIQKDYVQKKQLRNNNTKSEHTTNTITEPQGINNPKQVDMQLKSINQSINISFIRKLMQENRPKELWIVHSDNI